MLDSGQFNADPNGERELLWWMGHAAVNSTDDAALAEATSRLDSLGSTHGDRLALVYAGFLRADHKIEHGDPSGVSEALRAAARVQDSSDPAIRALVKFQVCDVYTMAGDTGVPCRRAAPPKNLGGALATNGISHRPKTTRATYWRSLAAALKRSQSTNRRANATGRLAIIRKQ